MEKVPIYEKIPKNLRIIIKLYYYILITGFTVAMIWFMYLILYIVRYG